MQFAHKMKDIALYLEIDVSFHQLLVDNCGNALLSDTYQRIITMVRQSVSNALRAPERFGGSEIEHMEIISLLRANLFEEAAKANEVHLKRTCEALINELYKG